MAAVVLVGCGDDTRKAEAGIGRAEEHRQQRLENWFNSDWTEELEAQQAQAEEEREASCVR